MNELHLLEPEETPKQWKDPRPALIDVFNKKYEQVTRKRNPFPFGACMNSMLHFETADKKTGEWFIEYPDIETWTEQVGGFFKDDFARDNRGYHFTYFIKQFGSFVRVFEKQMRKVNIQIECDNCHKLRQPFGACEHCGC